MGRVRSSNEEVFTGPILGGGFVVMWRRVVRRCGCRLIRMVWIRIIILNMGRRAAYGSFAPGVPPGVDSGRAVGDADVSVSSSKVWKRGRFIIIVLWRCRVVKRLMNPIVPL